MKGLRCSHMTLDQDSGRFISPLEMDANAIFKKKIFILNMVEHKIIQLTLQEIMD